MKVLKRGKVKEKVYHKTCHNCKSKLEYKDSDIECDRDGDYIICPVCKKFIAIGSTDNDWDR